MAGEGLSAESRTGFARRVLRHGQRPDPEEMIAIAQRPIVGDFLHGSVVDGNRHNGIRRSRKLLRDRPAASSPTQSDVRRGDRETGPRSHTRPFVLLLIGIEPSLFSILEYCATGDRDPGAVAGGESWRCG